MNSLLLIFIPLIFLLFFIFIARISAQSINKYWEIGSPCLQPRSVYKKEEKLPLWFIATLICSKF